MKSLIIASIATLLGVVITLSVVNSRETTDYQYSTPSRPAETPSFTSSADDSLEERLYQLEQRLAEETKQRQALEMYLENERNMRLALADRVSEISNLENRLQESIESVESRTTVAGRFAANAPNPEEQHSLLLDAGFSAYEADVILSIEAEMQEQLENASATNRRVNIREIALEAQTEIRSELGDTQYELYLETTGRPTTVPVARINEESAGYIAGIQQGDEIISYDGERVFSILDLQNLTGDDSNGETVIVDVMRDDSPIAIAIPKGEIGISTRGNTDRRRPN